MSSATRIWGGDVQRHFKRDGVKIATLVLFAIATSPD